MKKQKKSPLMHEGNTVSTVSARRTLRNTAVMRDMPFLETPPPSPHAGSGAGLPDGPSFFFPPQIPLFFLRLAFLRKLGYPAFMQNDRHMLSRIFFVMMAERHWRSHL